MRRFLAALALLSVALSACDHKLGTVAPHQGASSGNNIDDPNPLKLPQAFAGITDRVQRSRALFIEASRVLTHPRCINCHSTGGPRQGDDNHVHIPPVTAGSDGRGAPVMRCQNCHQERNFEFAEVPGAPDWHLAPATMIWLGLSAAELCAQLKDPARNGKRSLAQVVEHSGHDKLVSWGWNPGLGRQPAPGNQQAFGALIAAWADSGAECPEK
jgi:hypothetical protein